MSADFTTAAWRNLLIEAMALCLSHYRPAGVRPPDSWIIEQLTRVGFLLSEINGVGLDAIADAIESARVARSELMISEEA